MLVICCNAPKFPDMVRKGRTTSKTLCHRQHFLVDKQITDWYYDALLKT